jgi:hypothetical protein
VGPDAHEALAESGRNVFFCAGMVLDVTRWLPEHPGGSTIIPAQVTHKRVLACRLSHLAWNFSYPSRTVWQSTAQETARDLVRDA